MTIRNRQPQNLRVLGAFCAAALVAVSFACEPAPPGDDGSMGAQATVEQLAPGAQGNAKKDAPGAPQGGAHGELISLRAQVRDLSESATAALAVGANDITAEAGAPRGLRGQ